MYERLPRFIGAGFVFAGLTFGFTSATLAATLSAASRVSALADEFYGARAEFDPLNFATANGDSRYDDRIGLSIEPKVRAAYFAHMHRLQQQLTTIASAALSESEQLNRDILDFEINSSLELEPYPENLLPISQMDSVPSTLANYASGNGSQPL